MENGRNLDDKSTDGQSLTTISVAFYQELQFVINDKFY